MSMAGYTKLFHSILASTIWEAKMPTRIVWITLLAMADKNGIAEGSVPGLATFARVPIKDVRKALEELQSPDENSRSKEYEGRRIEEVDGGWRLINHAKYRKMLGSDERREYLRQKQAEYRQRKNSSTNVNNVSDTYTLSTHTEAEAEAEAKKSVRTRAAKKGSHEERAGTFCQWYEDTHQRLFGVGYMGAGTDYQKALQLVAKFTDDELRDGALVWFGMDDDFATTGTRTIPKFASRITSCLQTARKRGIA